MRRLLLAVLLTLVPASLSAQTLTTRDIVALNQSGLGEEVLLALIEVHRSVFPVDAETLRSLKAAGVPQKVIAAMVKSGRDYPVSEPVIEPEPAISPRVPQSQPQVVVIDHPREATSRTREVAVPVAVPVYVPVRVHPGPPVKRVEPVFWGFGGKLRPDAWKPVETHHKPFFLVEGPQKK
jgi:hypothetical protein